jgi:hypothetical protein
VGVTAAILGSVLRWLLPQALSGVVMLPLGLVLLLRPDWWA